MTARAVPESQAVSAGERSARERREAHEGMAAAPAQSSKVSVDDFVRAAGGAASEEATSAPDEKPVAATAAAPVLVSQKPAPIVRRAAIAAPVTEIASVTAEPRATPKPMGLQPATPEMVDGFGAEVDVMSPAARPASVAKMAPAARGGSDPADSLTAEDRREITEEAVKPVIVPLYTRSGKLMMPPPLKGSHEILVHQNEMADDAGLSRIQDDDDLNHMRSVHLLVSFPETPGLEVNADLPANRRCARPWTVRFVSDTARAYYARFHEPLRLSSAVRTVAYQLRLQRVNGNAAAVDGDGASPHLTGQAIDFGKSGMSVAEIAWMRLYLMPLIDAGKVDVEEEFQQACFHISVYGSYLPKKRAVRVDVAQLRDGRE